MRQATEHTVDTYDRSPQKDFLEEFRKDVRDGLSRQPKQLPPKYFYDERGSELFEQITELPEYYQTRTEASILRDRAFHLASISGFVELVEFGSGSSEKTRTLLQALLAESLETYIPIDVSREFLLQTARQLSRDFSRLLVKPVVGDFMDGLDQIERSGPGLILFLGGTIGNLPEEEARSFLSTVAREMRDDDMFLLGCDFVKDPSVLHAAYNDSAGVTARFNRNVLRVINSRLGADFEPGAFWHYSSYNAEEMQIEMRLISRVRQRVNIPDADLVATFEEGEPILTEISRKFTRTSAEALLRESGLDTVELHSDENQYFGLLLAKRSGAA